MDVHLSVGITTLLFLLNLLTCLAKVSYDVFTMFPVKVHCKIVRASVILLMKRLPKTSNKPLPTDKYKDNISNMMSIKNTKQQQ